MTGYNPNTVGQKGSIFGYPYSVNESDLVLIPVPWDVTVSHGAGTSNAPELVLNESSQLDFSIPSIDKVYTYPVAMASLNKELKATSANLRTKAEQLILRLEKAKELTDIEKGIQAEINRGCSEMVKLVKKQTTDYLQDGKMVGLIGGDHSTPLGLLQALGEAYDNFGILQVDAHMDLRDSYEGFTYSHASIMKHTLGIPSVSQLVQVGIRDYCEEEENVVKELNGKVKVYFDEVLKQKMWGMLSWSKQAEMIINDLPEKVYISFDMDGLDPSLCSNTGSPVPGGLSFREAVYLIERVVLSGREIIGFDVSETGNGVWDANVASRILIRLCGCAGITRGRLAFT